MMGDGEDLDHRPSSSVDHGVRKAAHWEAAGLQTARHLRDGATQVGMVPDQFQCSVDLGQELLTEPGPSFLVPGHGGAELLPGRVLDAKAPNHLRRISASI